MNYIPKKGERVLISPPNSDNLDGYVYQEYNTIDVDDEYITYGNDGCYPNIDKIKHCLIKQIK